MASLLKKQETRTKKEELTKMYERLDNSINLTKQEDENLIILGDFNAKIAIKKGTKTQKQSTAGKMLEKLEKQNKLYIINRNEKTTGFYTREDEHSKSMIDYVMIDKRNKSNLVANICPINDKIITQSLRCVYSY